MADNKGNVIEEYVVKLSADTSDFDNGMEKADDTLDKQMSNVKKLQKTYQSMYDGIRNSNRQFKNTGKQLGDHVQQVQMYLKSVGKINIGSFAKSVTDTNNQLSSMSKKLKDISSTKPLTPKTLEPEEYFGVSLSELQGYKDKIQGIINEIRESQNYMLDNTDAYEKDDIKNDMKGWKKYIENFYSDFENLGASNGDGGKSIVQNAKKTMDSLDESFAKTPRSISGLVSWLGKVGKALNSTSDALKPYIDAQMVHIDRGDSFSMDDVFSDEEDGYEETISVQKKAMQELAIVQKESVDEGVKAQTSGAEQIQTVHTKATEKVKNSYKSLQKTIASVGQNISEIMEDATNKQTAIGRVIEMQKQAMRSVVNTKFNTDEYDYALERYKKESSLLDELTAKKKRMRASGTKGDSTVIRGVLYDIDEAEQRLAQAKQDIEDIKSRNYMHMDSTDTEQYKELSKQLKLYQNLQDDMEYIKSDIGFNNFVAEGQSISDIKDIPKELAKANKEASLLRNTLNLLKFPNMRKHMGYFSKEAEEARVDIEKLEAEIRELGSQRFKTDEFKKLEADVNKSYKSLDSLYTKLEKMQALGTQPNSSPMKSLIYDIQTAQKNIIGLLDAQKSLLFSDNGVFVPGTQTQQYADMEAQLTQMKAGLAEIEAQGQTVARSIASNIGGQLKNALGKGVTSGVKIAKAGLTNLANTAKTVKKHFTNLGKSVKSMFGGDAFLGSPMSPKGIYMFSQMWLQFSMISAIFGEVKRSMDNFAKSFQPFNDALSRMINSLRAFGAQIMAVFEPIVVVAVPYVEKLIDTLTKAMDTLAQFTARLTGNQMYTKASKGNYNYAESLDTTSDGAKKATKAVKEYQNTVLGFDQLNKLNGIDDEEEIDVGLNDAQLNKAQTQSTKLNKIADAIHKALSQKDYKGAGKAVADGINEAFSWVKNVAGWEANSKRVTNALRNVIDFVNSLADEFKGTKAGQAIGDVANTIIESLKILTDPTKGINFALIGTRIGQMIKGAVDTVHWDSLGMAIVQSIQGMLDFVNGIISVPEFWVSIGTAIANGIRGMIEAYDPSKVADLVVNLVNGLAQLLVTAFGGDNASLGAEIGAKLADTVNQIFEGLKPEQIANGINAFVNTITSAINTFIADVDWSMVLSTVGTALADLDWLSIIELIGIAAIPKIPGIILPLLAPVGKTLLGGIGKALGGLFGAKGLGGALKNIGGNIGRFFTTGKGAGSLSSLGTLLGKIKPVLLGGLKSIGGLLLKGLSALGSALMAHPIIAIIAAIVIGIVTFVVTHWEEVKTFFIDTWNKISEIASSLGTKIQEIWTGISEWFGNIKTKAGEVVESVKTWFIELPDNISEGVRGVWETVTGWFSDLKEDAEGVVSDIAEFFTSLPDKIRGGWDKAKNWVAEKLPFGKQKITVATVPTYSNIPKLAGGGIVGDGQLFIANENGPELVGQHNGQTAVMNNMQIVTAVTRGVRDAMAEVLMTFGNNGGDGDGGDIVIMVDSEELARASIRGQRKLDKRNNPSVSFA